MSTGTCHVTFPIIINYSLAKPHPLCATPTLCRWVWLSEIRCVQPHPLCTSAGGWGCCVARQPRLPFYLLSRQRSAVKPLLLIIIVFYMGRFYVRSKVSGKVVAADMAYYMGQFYVRSEVKYSLFGWWCKIFPYTIYLWCI